MVKSNSQIGRPKSPIYGVGINDADYVVQPCVDGKVVKCKIYAIWVNMLCRAYSAEYHARVPTYIDVTVCPEWHLFMNFRRWVLTQNWEGFELDKDITDCGNKVYSPEKCIFVTKQINMLLTSRDNDRGPYPQGVDANSNKYRAQGSDRGKKIHIGLYVTPEEASTAYRAFKHKHITEVANAQTDTRIKAGLLRHAETYLGENT